MTEDEIWVIARQMLRCTYTDSPLWIRYQSATEDEKKRMRFNELSLRKDDVHTHLVMGWVKVNKPVTSDEVERIAQRLCILN